MSINFFFCKVWPPGIFVLQNPCQARKAWSFSTSGSFPTCWQLRWQVGQWSFWQWTWCWNLVLEPGAGLQISRSLPGAWSHWPWSPSAPMMHGHPRRPSVPSALQPSAQVLTSSWKLWQHSPRGPQSLAGLWGSSLLSQAMPFSRGPSWPRDQTLVSWIAGRFFTVWATRKSLNDILLNTCCWSIYRKRIPPQKSGYTDTYNWLTLLYTWN